MDVNKIEANILLKNIDDYKIIKQYVKENQIKVLGEYFYAGDKKIKVNLFCSINVLITMSEYQELAALTDNTLNSIELELITTANLNNPNESLSYYKNFLNDPEKIRDQVNDSELEGLIENPIGNLNNEIAERIDGFIGATNLFMLNSFKKDPDIIEDYMKSELMSYHDKLQDIGSMIKFFEGNPDQGKDFKETMKNIRTQRYEDCSFLLDIYNRIKEYYEG